MKSLHTGLDVGSTTIKVAVIDDRDVLRFSHYQRHYSEVRKTIVEVLLAAAGEFAGEASTLVPSNIPPSPTLWAKSAAR